MRKGAEKAMNDSPLPALHKTVKRYLYELSDLEYEGSPDFYKCADVFGILLGKVFAFDEKNTLTELQKEDLYEIGYRTGRFIYLLDAYEDREKDEKEKRYNPFLKAGITPDDEFKSRLITALDLEMLAAKEALQKLKIADGGVHAILENLIAYGLPDVARAIILENRSTDEIHTESDKIR